MNSKMKPAYWYILVITGIVFIALFFVYTELQTRGGIMIQDGGCCQKLNTVKASKTIIMYYSVIFLLCLSLGIYLFKKIKFLSLLLGIVAIFMVRMVYYDYIVIRDSKQTFDSEKWRANPTWQMANYIASDMELELKGISEEELIKLLGKPSRIDEKNRVKDYVYKTDDCRRLVFMIAKGKVYNTSMPCS